MLVGNECEPEQMVPAGHCPLSGKGTEEPASYSFPSPISRASEKDGEQLQKKIMGNLNENTHFPENLELLN